jgi:hypothetical protein
MYPYRYYWVKLLAEREVNPYLGTYFAKSSHSWMSIFAYLVCVYWVLNSKYALEKQNSTIQIITLNKSLSSIK